MGTLLKIVGGIWAIIGTANVVVMFWTKAGEGGEGVAGLLSLGLVFNFVLFIIPGLIVYGIGAGISKKRQAASQSTSSIYSPKTASSIEARLQRLEDLKSRGAIRPEEYEARRAEILREV